MGFLSGAGRKARRAEAAAAAVAAEVAAAEAECRAAAEGERRAVEEAVEEAVAEVRRLVLDGLGLCGEGEFEAARPVLAEAVRRATEALGPDAPTTLTALAEYGSVLHLTRRHAEAEPVLRAVVAGTAHLPEHRQDHRDARRRLGSVLLRLDRPAEAAAELEAALEPGPGPEDDRRHTALSLLAGEHLAQAYGLLGRPAEAAVLYADLAALREREFGPTDASARRLRVRLAMTRIVLGDYREAERTARELLLTASATAAPSAARRTGADVLARALVHQGRAVEGEAVAREAIAAEAAGAGAAVAEAAGAGAAVQAPGPQPGFALRHALIEALDAQQRHREALDLALDALAAHASDPASPHLNGVLFHTDLAAARLGLGHHQDALRALDRAAADRLAGGLAPHHHFALVADTLRGRALAALGRTAEARAVLAATAAARREQHGPEHPRTLAVELELALLGG